MALFAIYLETRQSTRGLSIKLDTIAKYIKEVAHIHYNLIGVDQRYYGCIPQSQNIPIKRSIKRIYDEIKCWENEPDF